MKSNIYLLEDYTQIYYIRVIMSIIRRVTGARLALRSRGSEKQQYCTVKRIPSRRFVFEERETRRAAYFSITSVV